MTDHSLKETPLAPWHREHGARMTEFGGWEMPLFYPAGILKEHLRTRAWAGLFDVSHMGRLAFRGQRTLDFLRFALSNDAAALVAGQAPAGGQSQYTLIPREDGSALDDAFLYRFESGEYLLVVNAANASADAAHLQALAGGFGVEIEDRTAATAMFALQGPLSWEVLRGLAPTSSHAMPGRNRSLTLTLLQTECVVSRTGYTGEPIGFEIFLPADRAEAIWTRLIEVGRPLGLGPIGLGARDTLRLEASLPLFGQEGGTDPDGRPMPILAVPSSRFGVSRSDAGRDFVGRAALERQAAAVQALRDGGKPDLSVLPRRVRPLAVLDPGVARHGDTVLAGDEAVGRITSGSVAPYWNWAALGQEENAPPPVENPLSAEAWEEQDSAAETGKRPVALAYVDVNLVEGLPPEILSRGRRLRAKWVSRHGRGDVPPFFRPVLPTA